MALLNVPARNAKIEPAYDERGNLIGVTILCLILREHFAEDLANDFLRESAEHVLQNAIARRGSAPTEPGERE